MRPTLRLSAAPRSVSDATRFTPNALHASSKTATPPPRFSPPKSAPGSAPSAPAGGSGGPGGGSKARASPLLETPEQRVARLRAAHRRAKEAQVSKFDKVVDASRRFFDSAHKITVAGLFGFTVIAGLATAYTAFDMIMYNKKRSAEWVEAQKKLEADSLEAARIAYMLGKANEEQVALVEEQLERERQEGRKTSFFSNIPSVLEPSKPASSEASASSTPSTPSQQPQSQSITETVSWPPKDDPTTSNQPESQPEPKTGLWAWLTSNLKREEEGDDTPPMSSSAPRLGWESLSEEDDATGVRDSDIVRAVEEKQARLRAKAAAAMEREKENQRQGGPLDRVGIEGGDRGVKDVGADEGADAAAAKGETGKKKGWFW